MSFRLEYKKTKRTGLIPAFVCGGLLAAAVPVLDMAVRSERYLGLDASPVLILLDADWQMMAMLNILLVAAGACLMYHTEYADNAIQRMCTLPMKESRLYFSKFALMTVLCIVALTIEASGMVFCIYHWFELSGDMCMELVKNWGYALFLMLPPVLCSLLIASACRNIWVSLGISVVCIFAATMMPTGSFALSLFPFALPFQIFAGTAEETLRRFIIATGAEMFFIAIAEVIFLNVRRSFE